MMMMRLWLAGVGTPSVGWGWGTRHVLAAPYVEDDDDDEDDDMMMMMMMMMVIVMMMMMAKTMMMMTMMMMMRWHVGVADWGILTRG